MSDEAKIGGSGLFAGLRRLASAPGWLGALWLVQVLVAAAIGLSLRASIEQAIAPHAIADDGRRLFALLDVLTDHRGAIAGFSAITLASALGGMIAWTLVSGAMIVRLSGQTDPREIAFLWWRSLPAVAVQSLWHVGMRGLVVFAVIALAGSVPRALTWPLLVLAWAACTVALDRTRAAVVLHGAPRFHPRTAATALWSVLRTPRRDGPIALLALAQLGVLASLPLLAVAHLGEGLVPAATRSLALAAVVLGLWRLAAVVATAAPLPPPPKE